MAEQDRPQLPAPVFILCPIRSFSSVACAMLGQHPELYAFPELRLFNADTVEGVMRFFERVLGDTAPELEDPREVVLVRHVRFFADRRRQGLAVPPALPEGLLRALAELQFGGQTEKAVKQAEAWLQARRDWSVGPVFDALLDRIKPRRGVDKTPQTAMSPQAMERLLALYPQARFLHLTRHPVTTQRSMQSQWRTRFDQVQPGRGLSHLASHAARVWLGTHQAVLNFTRALPPGQALRVRGEDLLSEPDTHLPRVARWLGVRTGPEAVEAMKHPERSPYVGFGPPGARLGNDHKFLEDARLRPVESPASLEAPAEWGLDAGLQKAVVELAGQLGYAGAAGGEPGP
jgi:hypothetical protein